MKYIDFISAYCDSWCERCGFTERCSHFAISVAEAMCEGDHAAAIELAIGRPPVPGQEAPKDLAERMADVLGDDEEPSTQELDRIGRELDDRRERLRRHALAEASYDYSIAAGRWFDGRREAVHNEVVEKDGEELATVQWDRFLIHVKIMRALTGRDEDPEATLAKAWDDYFKSGSGNAGDPPRSRD